ncbi:MAG: FHA domain-containing protein, partial [Caldilineae bacterium]
MTNPNDTSQDHILIRHPDGSVSKEPLPAETGTLIRLGRELDNDIILVDPRASRHHAQLRRAEGGGVEITDAGSANGTFVGGLRVRQGEWSPLAPGQVVRIGDTQVVWEEALASQRTVGMAPVAPAERPPAPAPAPRRQTAPLLPWLIGAAVLVAVVAIVSLFASALRST